MRAWFYVIKDGYNNYIMGEKVYDVGHKFIQYSEDDVEFMCLCTFPHNDQEHLEIDRLKSLAIFGAVVRLIHDGYYSEHGDYIYIPRDVPEWVLEGVRRLTMLAPDAITLTEVGE